MFVYQVVSTEKEWKYWCDTESPEEEDIPCGYHQELDVFRSIIRSESREAIQKAIWNGMRGRVYVEFNISMINRRTSGPT